MFYFRKTYFSKTFIIFIWSLWLVTAMLFVSFVKFQMVSFPLGSTTDIYELNQSAALRLAHFENPYSFSFLMKSKAWWADAYAVRYVYPPGGLLCGPKGGGRPDRVRHGSHLPDLVLRGDRVWDGAA